MARPVWSLWSGDMATKKFARVVNDVVLEIIEIPAENQLENLFHKNIVNTCIAVSNNESVEIGWVYNKESQLLEAPPTKEAVTELVVTDIITGASASPA